MTDPDTPDMPPEPANLRFLRLLVTGLTGVMIAGLVVIIVLFVTRFPDPRPDLPDQIALPDGVSAQAITMGKGWYAVVTEDERILIFDRTSGDILQDVQIR